MRPSPKLTDTWKQLTVDGKYAFQVELDTASMDIIWTRWQMLVHFLIVLMAFSLKYFFYSSDTYSYKVTYGVAE